MNQKKKKNEINQERERERGRGDKPRDQYVQIRILRFFSPTLSTREQITYVENVKWNNFPIGSFKSYKYIYQHALSIRPKIWLKMFLATMNARTQSAILKHTIYIIEWKEMNEFNCLYTNYRIDEWLHKQLCKPIFSISLSNDGKSVTK